MLADFLAEEGMAQSAGHFHLATRWRLCDNASMQLLDLTLPDPAENLALDEALLDAAEALLDVDEAGQSGEVLRLWEPAQPMVVLGRSSRIDEEVDRDACNARGIPIFRRPSGGLTILTGPGCLMYAVVLSCERRPELRRVDRTHEFVLERNVSALSAVVPGVARHGTSDLAIARKDSLPRKFSGNSIRVKRDHLLYHGTILYDFPLEQIAACLKTPPRMPDYRGDRSHTEFVRNLPLPREAILGALIAAWNAVDSLDDWPRERTRQLAAERYASQEWTELR